MLPGATRSLAESFNTSISHKLSDIVLASASGSSVTLSGADANCFEVVGQALYLKAGVSLDYETQTTYTITLNVVDVGTNELKGLVDYTLSVQPTQAEVAAVRIASATHADGAQTGALHTGGLDPVTQHLPANVVDTTNWRRAMRCCKQLA